MENRRGIIVHPDEVHPKLPERMLRGGLNTLGLHPVGGGNAHLSLEKLLQDMETPEYREKLETFRRAGIAVEYEMHALTALMPRPLFEKHPDWFRMDETGTRTPNLNLCAGSAEALEALSESACRLARKLPSDTGRYFFWLDDAREGACHCEKCRGLSPSDQALTLYNAICRGVQAAHSGAKLAYLAYFSTLEPPKAVRPAEGIFLEYAPFDRDPHRPMGETECAKNASEAAHLPALLDFFGKKDSRVLEYWMDNSMYSGWKKPPKAFALDEAVMAQDVPWYLGLGFEDLTGFGCFLGKDYEALHGAPPVETYGRILTGCDEK